MTSDDDLGWVVPIPDCLPLLENEMGHSYLARLATYYGYASSREFCGDFGLNHNGILMGAKEALVHLAILTGADEAALLKWSPVRISPAKFAMNGVLIHRQFGPRSMAKQCPECVRACIAANPHLPPDLCIYGRGEWHSGYVEVCDIHRVALLEHRGKSQKIEYLDASRLQQEIYEELEGSPSESREPTSFERYALSKLRGATCEELRYVDQIDMPELARTCLSLGRDIVIHRDMAGLDERTCRAIGFDVLAGGPASLERLIKSFEPEKGTDGSVAVLPKFVQFMARNPHAHVAALRHQVWMIMKDRAASGVFPPGALPSEIESGELIDASAYGVAKSVLFELAEIHKQLTLRFGPSGNLLVSRAAADALLKGYTPLVSRVYLAKVLGRDSEPTEIARRLEKAGVISGPFVGTELLHTGPLYSRPRLDGELSTFMELFERVRTVPDGMVSLKAACGYGHLSAEAILRMVVRRELSNVCFLDGKPLLGALHFDPEELIRNLFGSQAVVSLGDAAVQLGFGPSMIRSLVDAGHLATVRPCIDGEKSKLEKVEQTEIDRFRERYMTFNEAINATRTRSGRGLERLGVGKAIEIRSRHQGQSPVNFYLRSVVEKVAASI